MSEKKLLTHSVFLREMVRLSVLPSQGGAGASAESDALRLTVYYERLQPKLTDVEMQLAADRALDECAFFPVPAKLLELVEYERESRRRVELRVDRERWVEECRERMVSGAHGLLPPPGHK